MIADVGFCRLLAKVRTIYCGRSSRSLPFGTTKTRNGRVWELAPKRNYSTVTELFPTGATKTEHRKINVFLCFELEITTESLWFGPYTPHQRLVFAKVSKLRQQNLTWAQIAEKLNEDRIPTARGCLWTGAHVHSVMKKSALRRQRLAAAPERRLCNFEMTFEYAG